MKFSIIIFALATLSSAQSVDSQIITSVPSISEYIYPSTTYYVYPSTTYYPTVYTSSYPETFSNDPETFSSVPSSYPETFSNVPSSNPETFSNVPSSKPSKTPKATSSNSQTNSTPMAFIPYTQAFLGSLLPSLTPSCQNTLNELVYNSTINQCLQELYTSFMDMTNPIESIITSIGSLSETSGLSALYPVVQNVLSNAQGELDQFCSSSNQCGAALVLDAASQLKSSCSDMTNPNPTMSVFYDAILLGQPIVESLCIKNSTNGYCVVETVSNFLPYLVADYGDVSIEQLGSQNITIAGFFAQFPSNITCTTCVSKITSTFQHDLLNGSPDIFAGFMQVDSAIVQKCGSNFLTNNTSSLSSRLSWTAIVILFFTVAIFF